MTEPAFDFDGWWQEHEAEFYAGDVPTVLRAAYIAGSTVATAELMAAMESLEKVTKALTQASTVVPVLVEFLDAHDEEFGSVLDYVQTDTGAPTRLDRAIIAARRTLGRPTGERSE